MAIANCAAGARTVAASGRAIASPANRNTAVVRLTFPGIASRLQDRQSQLRDQGLHSRRSSHPPPEI
jgi:hypothetical protein